MDAIGDALRRQEDTALRTALEALCLAGSERISLLNSPGFPVREQEQLPQSRARTEMA